MARALCSPFHCLIGLILVACLVRFRQSSTTFTTKSPHPSPAAVNAFATKDSWVADPPSTVPADAVPADAVPADAAKTGTTPAFVSEVQQFLVANGFKEYVKEFAHHEIEYAQLCDLTTSDLTAIGVGSVGIQKRMITAMRETEEVPELDPQVRAFLVKSGLAIHIREFAKHHIRYSDMTRMTVQSLKDVIPSLGQRMAIVRAFRY